MKVFRQLILSLAVLAAGLYVWVSYVPASLPMLDRLGVLEALGIEPPMEQDSEQQTGGPRGGPARVIIAKVGEQALVDRISTIGDGRARRSVDVRSNAMGTITHLNLVPGGYVQAGTVIARLQDEAERIALEQGQIQLEDARTDAERIRQLQGTGAVTEVRLRESELALRSAELAVRQAEFDLSQRQIEAPISGWVGIINLEVGDRVSAQDLLVTITDRSEILIDFRIPERVVGKIRAGLPIEVTPLGLRELTLTGEISAIDTVVDRSSRTLLVQGRLPNKDEQLRAGMAFAVNMTFPGETVLSIAPLAVQWSSDGPFVWVVHDAKVTQVAVTIVQRNRDSVLVTSDDLKVGDNVVTEGVQTLREGGEVSVENLDEAASDLSVPQDGATL
ncbi:efflux RND transporter periplasmic adaptor subunit [Roseovarius aestuarii]|nr:efflux RND transporter periplasmic adaptor subunit [Roseovarius aestuarii]